MALAARPLTSEAAGERADLFRERARLRHAAKSPRHVHQDEPYNARLGRTHRQARPVASPILSDDDIGHRHMAFFCIALLPPKSVRSLRYGEVHTKL